MVYEEYVVVPITIYKGGYNEESFTQTDQTGTPIDFATDGDWEARAQFRDTIGGSVIFALDSDPAAVDTVLGLITLADDGSCTFSMEASVTDGLDATSNARGRQTDHYIGDLEIWRSTNTDDGGSPRRFKAMPEILARVTPEVTTS